MKLLFDQNLSPRLVDRLNDVYPNSVHVMDVDLDRALDHEIWTFAHENDFAIVTKDSDFGEISVLRGSPPNVVWIRRGNCSTQAIETLLRQHYEAVTALKEDPESAIVELH
jgi:predicted nuclease of predicted toxin-antitoxin system